MQGLINLPSDRKHKSNLGASHIFAKLRRGGGVKKGDSTNTIEKTYISCFKYGILHLQILQKLCCRIFFSKI